MKNKELYLNYTVLVGFLLLMCNYSVVAQDQFDTGTEETTEKGMIDDQDNYLDLKSGWFLGATAGPTLFYGDVTTYNFLPKFNDIGKSLGSGVSVFGGKKIKWGLSAEIQVASGRLKGSKESIINNPFFFNTDFQTYSFSAKYNISDFYSRKMGQRSNGKIPNRLNTYLSVGIGQIFYRSRLNYANDNRLKQTYGYKESSNTQLTGQQLLEKDKSFKSLIVPIGAKFQYRMNFKTDIVFDFYYVNSFTDKLDAWERSWTKDDRYMYVGVGLVLHFGRSESDDIPQEMRTSSHKDNVSDDKSSRKGLFSGKKRSSTSSDEDLNLRLKLFETQLKLFEMQHMIDEKK